MNPWESFWVGIAPEHGPALLAVLAVPVAFRVLPPALVPLGPVRRWAAALLAVAGAVHLALPLGGHGGPAQSALFLLDGALFVWLCVRVRRGRAWRRWAVPLVAGTLAAYLAVVGSGREEADQVGIATALVELTILGLALVPVPRPDRPRRLARLAGGVAFVVATVVTGVGVWIGTLVAHDDPRAARPDPAAAAGHSHGHAHVSRAQAGVVVRPGPDRPASYAETRAALDLAGRTRRAMARYADLDSALADGYALPGNPVGEQVHLEHAARKKDGRVLDPARPEQLVYAIGADGTAVLLGAVYQMERAGDPGPAPGGPITNWHAHNVCLTVLPPGFGIVSPFGSCPPLSVAVTSPEMMHIWIVDNPGGPFAEDLDREWIRATILNRG